MAGERSARLARGRGSAQRRRHRLIRILISILGVGVLALLALVVFPRLAGSDVAPWPETRGAAVPDFAIRTLDGGTFRLSEHRGRVVAIYTMAGWCLSCIPEAKAWARLYSEYH